MLLLGQQESYLLFLHSISFAILLHAAAGANRHTLKKNHPLTSLVTELYAYFCSLNKILHQAAGMKAFPLLYLLSSSYILIQISRFTIFPHKHLKATCELP